MGSEFINTLQPTILLAFVIADKIQMRCDKYKPETEEGRKLLTHEHWMKYMSRKYRW